MESPVNPWIRANLEQFNPETLGLIPEGYQQEYIRIMKELAHAKAIANLALERVHLFETERHDFFDYVTQFDETGYPPNVTEFAKDLVDHEAAVIEVDFTHRERLR